MRLVFVAAVWLLSVSCSWAQNQQCPTPDLGAGKPVANGPTCASQAFVTNHYPSGATAGHVATFADSSGQVLQDGGAIPAAPTGANPTATAGPAAVNGSSPNFMRADAAPAVQKGTNSQFGLVECDGVGVDCAATPGIATIISASKAQQQAGSLATVPVTPQVQQQHQSAAKAWVHFTGSASNGAQTINASYNVSGVSRTGAGAYTINFTTAFSSIRYVCTGAAYSAGTVNGFVQFGTPLVGSIPSSFINISGPVGFDPTNGGVIACFGTQ